MGIRRIQGKRHKQKFLIAEPPSAKAQRELSPNLALNFNAVRLSFALWGQRCPQPPPVPASPPVRDAGFRTRVIYMWEEGSCDICSFLHKHTSGPTAAGPPGAASPTWVLMERPGEHGPWLNIICAAGQGAGVNP